MLDESPSIPQAVLGRATPIFHVSGEKKMIMLVEVRKPGRRSKLRLGIRRTRSIW